MTVPLDVRNDIREMDAGGVPRSEIARRLHVSRNTVAKYADMGDLSPEPPLPADRPHPATDAHAGWIDGVLEADLGAPRKQRHTAKRICDRLVEERGYEGSYSSVQRRVREWRLRRAAGAGDGYLELEWAPGTARADYGNFEAVVGGERLRLKLLVVCLPRSNARFAVAGMSQRAERVCAGLAEAFEWIGRAPRELVLDNATEAGRRVRGEAAESHLFSLFRAHYRMGSRYCNPYSGNEKGSVENAVGFIRRNLLVPVPRVGSLAEPDALLRAGCDRPSASSRARDGRLTAEALPEDLAAMLSLPSAPFDAVRWVRCRADRRGVVTVDGRGYLAGPAWHSRELLVGVRAGTVEVLADRGRRVALLPRAFGDGPAVRSPLSLVPAPVARPRAFGESVTGRDMPEGLVRAIDSLDAAGRRRALRSIERASGPSGFDAACAAAQRVLEGGRVPDDATVDVLARRIAAGGPAAEGGATRPPATGSRGEAGPMPASGELGRRVVEAGRRCSLTGSVLREWAGAGSPRQVEYLAGYLEAEAASRDASKRAALLRRCGLPAPKTFDGYDWSAVSWPEGLGREELLSLSFLERREDLVLMGDVGTGKTHMASALCQLACDRGLEARFLAASTLVMRLRRAREEGRLDREMSQVARARLLVIDELGFLPLDADGARLVFQAFADAYERQSVAVTTNLEFSRWGGVFGDDQMAAAVIDRVVHHGRLVQFRGESYRVRHALIREG